MLIVEDQSYITRLIEKILISTSWPIEMDFASNGIDAIEKIDKKKPDLIIVDLYLPGKSGFEICRYVQNQKKLKTTCVLAMSGDINETTKEKIIETGASGFIRKPFTKKEFLEQIIRVYPKVDKLK